MFNMFRMDIYRLIRSRFVYVCLALIIGMQALSYLMIYMVGTEEGREAATQAGMIVTVDGEEEIVLEGVDSLVMYRQALMDGGAYATIFGIASVLFLCSDFQGGFLKNIMTQHRQRWKYIGSKLIALGSLNLIYLLLSVGANYLLNLLWKGLVPSVPLSAFPFYLMWIWLVTMAFGAMTIMVSVFTRSTVAGVLTAVFMCSGLLMLPLSALMEHFNLGGWMKYTLYYNMAYGPSTYSTAADLLGAAVGLGFLAVYGTAAAVALTMQDI